ncbi:MAG TPA: glycosyltransferase family 4 protein [Xanthomonadaceae bacterium]|jgi:phosphatidylinositol alpha-1,6-mannosyltransferase|nr:glycosyltransferase family 4 protein [Xanthomonadaceae bacterium]
MPSTREDKGSERLRVLLITRNLPPLRGGMERLNLHMIRELAREFDVAVVGPQGSRALLPDAVSLVGVAAAPLWKFFAGAFSRGIAAARRFRPDVVLAGSGLAAPFAWMAARCARARCVVYVHGLDLIAEHPVFRWFWRPFIRRADQCIANSANTAALARSIGIDAWRIVIVHPGVDMPPDEAGTNDFRARFELGERPLLLSVGRLIARKGLLEFVENALPAIAGRFPDVCMVVLGDETPELLQGSSIGLGDRIRERAAALGIAGNVRFIGPQDDATLAEAYRAADAHVFPVRDTPGDVEGFGMVAVEAAAHGLPTVAFAVGGVPDAILDGISGHLVAAGDYAHMAERTMELLEARATAPMRESSCEFAKRFEWTNFGTLLREHIRKAGTQGG